MPESDNKTLIVESKERESMNLVLGNLGGERERERQFSGERGRSSGKTSKSSEGL